MTAAIPFFLDTPRGKRFCLFHAPAGRCAGAVLYVHPFGDEMNASRRMAALQSRAFAASGIAVLQMDLFGCGDSEGELRDASWEMWRRDLSDAAAWLHHRTHTDIVLWGLRLGCMLALDCCRSSPVTIRRCILWQPILAGRAYMTQFLRLRLAADMAAGAMSAQKGTQAWRDALRHGAIVEAGGYELTAALVDSIDRIDLSSLREAPCPLHWFEAVGGEEGTMPQARANVVRQWTAANPDARVSMVNCPAFWATKEIAECPELIAATTSLLSGEQR